MAQSNNPVAALVVAVAVTVYATYYALVPMMNEVASALGNIFN